VEVVGVGGAEAGNSRPACAQEVANSEWVWTMRQWREIRDRGGCGVEIARWAQVAFDDFSIEIGDDHVRGVSVL